MYNTTNYVQEYLSGNKIRVEELGPYVYDERWQREGVAWLNGDTEVKFRMKRSYYFRPDLTTGSLDDVVTLPNVPMFVRIKF